MNCFAHGLPFLDRPNFMVGCCVPDWLSSADRKCRAREKRALEFVEHNDSFIAEVAQGIVQHHRDDDWFHQTRAFAEMSMTFAVEIREVLSGEVGFRAGLLGHILIELLLDAYLHQRHPGKLELYYEQVARVDGKRLQDAVNLFATRPTDKLEWYREKYLEARFLFDYVEDERLIYRVNQVLKRVKLQPLDDRILAWLPSARQRVEDRAEVLLEGYHWVF